ncbi:kinesin-like protein KIN-7F [Durio zibethinus]|uniref:Kinesin-like protein KIN-7F n=1 Tax=Durio zibethinus TaxID=66656 RepID=A0A6P6AW88_DURZI|nr:kinesin-like protein KIN-7F [Durio zibethinus]
MNKPLDPIEYKRITFIRFLFNAIQMSLVVISFCGGSVKDLIRERGMLSKQIPKKFSRKERAKLYEKWGIGLNTKQRSLQLARRIWTDTKDMVHVKESADLVAKLLRFVEQSQAPKEVVGLSILPPRSLTRRSYSWKHSIPPLS